ncbi:ferrochelatase [Reichenbachiella sp. MALMAid0571]|uniref:ferrochelatase n=1 Tax=Reichenbachiella sp. MALMAid0571 TaxID=3143939 RepID=UPI0032DF671C
MTKSKKGVLLVNLGTPDDPGTSSVRRYLREFLMDGRVIDIPYLNRWMLINLIIAPIRGPKSAKEYQRLWDERGSPLKYYGEDLTQLVQESVGDEYAVELAMRYQNPSVESALDRLKKQGVNSILIIPLFPQYASASTGSVIEEVNRVVGQWQVIPELNYVNNFFDNDLFLKTIEERASVFMKEKEYDHYVFSYHGLPERQILKAEIKTCKLGECCNNYGAHNKYCYRAQCFETSKLLAQRLNIPQEKYTVSFQSRLGKTPWIKPYTDHLIAELATGGVKNVLVFSPAFISDCLETTLEVGETYKEQFIEAGGDSWDLVESLNTHPTWVKCLVDIIRKKN